MPVDVARIEEIFGGAVTKTDAAERATYLDEACGGDAALRRRVEQLLAAHEATGNFLRLPESNGETGWNVPVTEGPKSKIGRYKLLEQIGEGGFGVVFMAEQEEPVRRLVALKIIKLGMDSRQVVARFEAERQALAMMDHPSVAKVLDGGATETGRPYFVMELVKGIPITEYCDKQQLTIPQRLELFSQVCQAVQHAHQKGLIHRDLKPSNVLVSTQDDRPVAKVIDFGVAKAVQARLTEKTLFTEFQQLVGTPAYMSPEQAGGSLDIDTRSDVYSLGVLLYELLTGTPPFDPNELRSKAFAELQRIIREVDPPTPSTRLSSLIDKLPSVAAQRSIEPRKLASTIRGELDWIVMRCLEKDRTRRYQTASALVQDIQHYLTDQPIEARPATRVYRIRKFIRRNKIGVLTGTAIAIALVIGIALATMGLVQARHQADIANTQAARSDQVAQFLKDMLDGAGPSVARGRDATILREILDKTAERIEKNLHGQPEVQGDLWYAIGTTYQDIGDYERSIPLVRHSVDSYHRAFGNESNKLALALGCLGLSESFVGDVRAGKADAERGLAIARKIGDPKTLANCLRFTAAAQRNYGVVCVEAEPFLSEELIIRRQLGEPLGLARCLSALAASLGHTAEAEQMARESLELHRQNLGSESTQYARSLWTLGQNLLNRDKFREAEPVLRQTYDSYRRIYAPSHPMQKKVREHLVTALAKQGKTNDVEALMRNALDANPSDTATWKDFGSVFALDGRWQLAVEHFSRGVELNPDSAALSFPFAVVLLQAGRQDKYRETCQDFLTNALNGKNPHYMDMAAKAALLLPVDGEDFDRACRIADGLTETTSEEWFAPWTYLLKSLADFRRERFESAIDWAGRVTSSTEVAPGCQAAALFVHAAAQAKLHRLDLAQTALASGDKVLEKYPPEYNADSPYNWLDWLVADILRHEATDLIEAKLAAPRP
jgi:serine/threonine protein kinase/tetratricopeptide (TPR) repeat protein